MIPFQGFPFAYSWRGERHDGSLLNWPPICRDCRTRACETTKPGPSSLCSYGVNYQRIDADTLVAGIVLRDWPASTPARKKRLRDLGAYVVPNAFLEAAVEWYLHGVREDQKEIAAEKARIVQDYADSEVYKGEFLKTVREDIQRGLAFFHDYKQINAQIVQNINVVVESRYAGASFDEKLLKASHAERAIYEAARFLEEKLNVARFLLTPDWLYMQDQCVKFRVHGLVLKYLRIYQRQFDSKGIKISVSGTSYADVLANPQACGVIPHTLLDNALKYSARGGRVAVDIEDEDGRGVCLSVGSFGPRILPEEARKIFLPFFRGQHARGSSEDGAGYGLYVAQLVAKEHLGVEISVQQLPTEQAGLGYWTTFEVTFPRKAKILP